MPPELASVAPAAGRSPRAAPPPKGGWHSWPSWSGILESRVPVLVLCTWLFLYAGRPFSLGFYSDDWDVYSDGLQHTGAFSPARFSYFIAGYTSRPVAGLIGFVISSIAGRNPIVYQFFCALFALLAALSVLAWLKSLLPKEPHPIAADLAAVVWLALPWSVAATAWPTCTMAALPAQIFFTESARLMEGGKGHEVRRLLLSAVLLLASYLTYETFYFQGILLAAFYWFRDGRGSGPWRHRLILSVCVVQAVSTTLNRFIAHLGLGVYKAFAPDWQLLFRGNPRFLPDELFRSAGSLGTVWTLVFGVIVLAAIASAVPLILKSEEKRLFGGLGTIALSLVSIPVFCLIYALAGYRMFFGGLVSRTLTGVSWAVAALIYGLLSVTFLTSRRIVSVAGFGAVLGFVIVSGMAQRIQVSDWAAVWQEEKAILARTPIEQIKLLPRDSQINILYLGPAYRGDLPIFGAVWELSGAVFSLPELQGWRSQNRNAVQIHPATPLYNWSWDGAELTQELPGHWKHRFAGKALYIWKYDENRIVPVEAGFHWSGRNGSGNPP
jgi:hypothetical protein